MVGASSDEIRAIRDSFLSAVRPIGIGVASCDVTDVFLDARITFGNTLLVGNVVRTAKSVVGRRFSRDFPSRPHPFAPGYMVRTIGTAVDPADAVRTISVVDV